MQQRAFPHLREDVEIEEVHAAENEQHSSDLGAEDFEHFLKIRGFVAVFQGERHVADVDQVETNDEQVIDGIGQRFIPVEGIDEEEPAVLVQRPRDPNSEGDADDEVEGVGSDDVVHSWFPFVLFICFYVFRIL